jgi:hypothetical protein
MANNTSPQTAAGRVHTNPPLSADPIRYSFLNLPNAEPNLSLPAHGANQNNALYALLSDPLTGGRYWSNNEIAVDRNTGYVGFNTDQPNNQVSVVGNLSATGYIYGTLVSPVIPGAAGVNTQVQYNNNGSLSGDFGFEYFQSLSAIVVGGGGNSTSGQQSSILGGKQNVITNNQAVIAGGSQNSTSGTAGFVGAGQLNTEQGDYTVIVGGRQNSTSNTYSIVVGGQLNNNGGFGSVIVGGQNNYINPATQYNGILGGQNNIVNQNNAFVIGSNITTVSANYTYMQNAEVLGQTILDASIGEGVSTISPLVSAVTIDLTKGTTFNLTLSSNVSSFNITNLIPVKVNSFTLYTIQNNIGGNRVSWYFNGNPVKWNAGLAPQISLSANYVDVYTFVTNNGGTTWYGFIAGQNFS